MTLEEIKQVPAIDVHSHFGQANMTRGLEVYHRLMPQETQVLIRNNQMSNIKVSVESHLKALMPRGGGDPVKGNQICFEEIMQYDGILMWAVVDPLHPESYDQAARMLQNERVVGIKVHPEEHRYPITRFGDEIYTFAEKHNAIIITHSGEQNSMPEDYAIFANRYPKVKTIISHLGCGWDGDCTHQIRAIQKNVHDNLFTDTSSAKSINCGLIEFAVRELGAEKLLFGTDTPCYFSPSQRARVDCADIPAEDKLKILYQNVLREFPTIGAFYEK